MVNRLTHTNIFVLDFDVALDFYVNKRVASKLIPTER